MIGRQLSGSKTWTKACMTGLPGGLLLRKGKQAWWGGGGGGGGVGGGDRGAPSYAY